MLAAAHRSSSMALLKSEPVGDQPAPLGWTDYRIPSADVGHGLWQRAEGVINSYQNPALEQSDEL